MPSWMNDPRLRDAMTIVWRFKWIVVTVAFLAIVAASLLIVGTPSSYTASASLLVKFGREYVYRPEVGNSLSSVPLSRTEEIVNSEIQILSSRDLKEKVVDALGWETLYPEDKSVLSAGAAVVRERLEAIGVHEFGAWIEKQVAAFENWLASLSASRQPPAQEVADMPQMTPREKAILRLEDDLKIEGVKDSTIINISYSNWNPQVAASAIEYLIAAFTEKRLGIYREPNLLFLRHQVNELREKLTTSEAALEAFRKSNDVHNIDEQIKILLQRESEFDNRLRDGATRINEIERRIAVLDEQLKSTPPTVTLSSETDQQQVRMAEQRLLELTLQEQQLLARYRSDHPMVQNMQNEMRKVQEYLNAQRRNTGARVVTGLNQIRVQLQVERMGLESQLEPLRSSTELTRQQLAAIRDELQKVSLRQRQLRDLERELSLNERNYEMFRLKAEEERATAALDEERRTNIRVVQPPVAPARISGLSKAVKVLLAGLFGTLLGAALAFVAGMRRRVFYSPASASAHLSLPVVLALPDLSRRAS